MLSKGDQLIGAVRIGVKLAAGPGVVLDVLRVRRRAGTGFAQG